tara:strand:- start:702 stop:1190 length:489 start_codon:yes stop_codon:yes gene_type:complete
MKKICPECSTELSCACRDGFECWCNELPKLLSFTEHNGCLCEVCLTKKIKTDISDFVEEYKKSEGQIENKAKEYDGDRKGLIEDIDFYREGKYKIFTEWYHLRRGTCCNSNCRHCPYKNDKPQNKIIYITGGARSGKSGYAQKLAKNLSPTPYYVATARHWD